MIGVSNHSCCSCNPDPCSTCPPKCKPITSADLATLVYIAGLDVNYCPKYQQVADVLGLVDCNGDPIVPGQPIVTCAQMQEQLCEIFSAFVSGGNIVPGTVLIGANCQKYTMPAFQSPLTVSDTDCIDLTLAGDVLSADLIISNELGNVTECLDSGVYTPGVCNQLLTISTPIVPADDTTVLITQACNRVNLSAYQENITVQDTSCLDLTFVGNVLSGAPIVSPTAGNTLSCTGNGLYVPTPAAETPITPVDTSCINLTVSGVNNHTVQADVVISPNAGNATECTANGIYTPDICTQLGDISTPIGVATPLTVFVDQDCNRVVLPEQQNITVQDTSCIDLTLAGSVLSANPVISPNAGNQLSCLANGLFVPQSVTDVTIAGVDTNCIDTTVIEGPANVFNISASPIISPAAGNQISCTAQGLFVPSAAGQVTCESVIGVFSDTGTAIDPGDNILTDACELKTFPDFVPQDTTSIDTSVTRNGSGDFVFSASAIVAPTAAGYPANCNGLVSGPSGLYAPPNSTGEQGYTPITGSLVNGTLEESDVVTSPNYTLNITNPSACRSAILQIDFYMPGVFTFGIEPGISLTEVSYNVSYNLPTILVTPFQQLTQLQLADNDTAAIATRPGSDMWRVTNRSQFIIPPSFAGSVSINVVVEQVFGQVSAVVENPGLAYTVITI